MISISKAYQVVDAYADSHGAHRFDASVIERGTFWFFPVGYIGSRGVIVDKEDGRLSVIGSALSLDDCFWGHEHGFSPELVSLIVTAVADPRSSVEFLLNLVVEGPPRLRNPNPRRAWLEQRLSTLPCEFAPQALWLRIPAFRASTERGWFQFELKEAKRPSPEP